MAGRADAFNPAELLLAALSACIINGIERVTPMLNFSFRSLEVRVNGVRQDAPPLMESIAYTVIIDTDETEQRLELLHENIRKYGTVFNTLSPGTNLTGTVERYKVGV
ncbi:MAG: OsmC family protein [Ghiorsea sp.]